MKRARMTLGVVALLVVAIPAMAGKIGFVDAERAVASVAEGKAKLKDLEAWAQPQRERLQALQQEAVKLQQEFNSKRGVATPDAMKELESKARAAARSFEDAKRAYDRDLDAKQNEFLSNVAVKVGTVSSDYGKANDFDAIFVLKAQPLIYIADSADLTDTIIRLYDERFPVQ